MRSAALDRLGWLEADAVHSNRAAAAVCRRTSEQHHERWPLTAVTNGSGKRPSRWNVTYCLLRKSHEAKSLRQLFDNAPLAAVYAMRACPMRIRRLCGGARRGTSDSE